MSMIMWVLFMFVVGMILVLVEFIVPGGLCGGVGAILLIASTILGCTQYPDHALWIIIAEIVGAMCSVAGGMFLLSRTRAGKAIILQEDQPAEQGWVAAESDMSLMDAVGEALTLLRPAGTILVDGKRLDAVADGSYIAKGTSVRVIEVRGSRIVVEQMQLEDEEDPSTDAREISGWG